MAFNAKGQIKTGDKFFNDHEYARSIPYYLKYYEKETVQREKDKEDNKEEKKKKEDNLPYVIEKLAHAYRLTQDYKNAEIFYSKALKTGTSNPKVARHYIEILKSNNKLEKSKEIFVVYSTNLSKYKNSFEVEVSKLEDWMDLEPIFEIEPVNKLNSKYADFSPFKFGDGIVFVSERLVDNVYKETYGWTKRPYLSVFYSEGDSTKFGKVKPFSGAINDEYHNGPIAFDSSETIAAFTRVQNLKKGADFVNKPQIYFATRQKKKWTKVKPFEHNDITHSFAHPALSADGKRMIFVSDMPGGFGGKDLYESTFENGQWSKPKSLGNVINSSEDEMFPYFKNDSVIYFSSNGFTGFGGLDIFKSTFKDGNWSTPENLKQPINSGKDDFGIMFFNNNTGLISSNRKEKRHSDDIFFFRAVPQKAPVNITGLFVYSELEPAAYAAIKLLDEDGNELMTTLTNENGEFVFEGLDADRNYNIVPAEDLASLSNEAKIYITNEKGSDRVELARSENGSFEYATLTPDRYEPLPTMELVDEPIIFNNILGRVYEELPGDVPEGLEVVLIDDDGRIAYSASVDANGNFQFEELPPDANFQIRVKDGVEDVKIVLTNNDDEAVAIIEQKDNAYSYELLKKDEATINLLSATDIPLKLRENLNAKIEIADLDPSTLQLILRNKHGEDISTIQPNAEGYFNLDTILPYRDYSVIANLGNGEELPLETNIYLVNEQGDKVLRLIREANDYFRFYALTEDEVNNLPALSTDGLQKKLAGKIFKKLPGDVPENLTVYLLTEDGLRIDSALVDAYGNFEFQKLPIDKPYKLKLADMEDDDVKMVIMSETGEQEALARKDKDGAFTYKQKLTFSGMVYNKIAMDKPDNMKVYLLDDDGGVLDIAMTDQFGNFNFDKLPTDKNFIIKTADALDSETSLIVMDDNGEIKDTLSPGDGDEFKYTNYTDLLTSISISEFEVGKNLEFEVINEKQKVIKKIKSNEFGRLKLDSLNPEITYNLKLITSLSNNLQKSTTLNILNSKGQPVQRFPLKDGNFTIHPLEQENYDLLPPIIPAKTKELLGIAYQTLPGDLPENLPVHLVDDKGKIVFTTFVDKDGKFEFEHLPMDGNYKLKLHESIDQGTLVITNKDSKALAVIDQKGEDFEYKLLKTDQASLALLKTTNISMDLRETILAKLILETESPEGISIKILDQDQKEIAIIQTNDSGEISMPNMLPYQDYKLIIAPKDVPKLDLNAALYILNNKGKVVKETKRTSTNTFEFESLTLNEYNTIPALDIRGDDDFFFGRVYKELPGDIPQGLKVYALDDNGIRIDSSTIDEYGNFAFEELPRDKSISLEIDPAIDDAKLVVINKKGDESQMKSSMGKYEYLTPDKFAGKLKNTSDSENIAGTKVFLLNEEGGILEVAVVDENGKFEFHELPLDQAYIIKAENEDPSNEILIIDEWGEENKLAQENGMFKKEVKQVFEGFAYNELGGDIPKGLKVFLLNDAGIIIDSTLLKENGSFAFQTNAEEGLSIKLDTDSSIQAFLVDHNKNKKPLAKNDKGEFVLREKTDLRILVDRRDPQENFDLVILNHLKDTIMLKFLPKNGLVDLKGASINQNVNIKLISKRTNKVSNNADLYLVNNEGQPVQRISENNHLGYHFYALKAEHYENLTTLATLETTNLEGFAYEKLRGDLAANIPVHLVNDAGKIVFTTFVDSTGKFSFKDVPKNQNLSVKIDDAIAQGKIVLVDEDENAIAIINQSDYDNFDYHILAADQASMELLSATNVGMNLAQELKAIFLDYEGEDIEVELVNWKKISLEKIKVADGAIALKGIEPYKNYKLLISANDASKIPLDQEIAILNSRNESVKLMRRTNQTTFSFKSLTSSEYDLIPPIEARQKDDFLYGRVYEELPGDIPEGLKVYMLNDKGMRIDSTVIDQYGNFVFEELAVDEPYQLSLANTSDDAKLVIVDDKGEENLTSKDNNGNFFHSEPEPMRGQLANSTEEGTKVYLLDENGGVIDVAVADVNGQFEFKELPPDQKFIIKAENEDPGEIVLIDEWGQKESLAKSADGSFQVERKQSYQGFAYRELAAELPENLKVYLTDDQGMILDSTFIDASGKFEFLTNIEEKNLSIQLANDDSDLKIDVITGNKRKALNKESGTFVLSREREVKGFFFSKLPNDLPQGMMVYLIDGKGNIIDSALTDSHGYYTFNTSLELTELAFTTNHKSFSKLQGEIIEYGINYTLGYDDNSYKPGKPAVFKGRAFYALNPDVPEDIMVYLLNKNGVRIDSSSIDKKGYFHFRYLDVDTSTTLEFSKNNDELLIEIDDDLAVEMNLIASNKFYKTREPAVFKGRAFYVLGPEQPTGLMVYLVDGMGNRIDSSLIDENGYFNFKYAKINNKTTLIFDDKVKQDILIDIEAALADALGLKEYEAYYKPNQQFIFKGRAFYPLDADIPEGMLVYLVDGQGNKLDSSIIDLNGIFQFNFNNLGTHTTLIFENRVKDNILIEVDDKLALALGLEEYQEFYRPKKPSNFKGRAFYPLSADSPEGLVLYLVDNLGRIVDSVVIGSNGFFDFPFQYLDYDEVTLIVMEQEAVHVDIPDSLAELFSLNRVGDKYEVANPTMFKGRAFYTLNADSPEGLTVYLLNKYGEIIDSSVTNSKGFFEFDWRYLENEDVNIAINSSEDILLDIDKSIAAQLELLEKGEYYQIQAVEATDFVIEGFAYKNLPGDLPKGKNLYLRDANNELVDVCAIDENGKFGFRKMPNDLPYQIHVENVGSGINIIVLDENQNKVALNMNALGNFELPIKTAYTLDNFDFVNEKNIKISVRERYYDYGKVYFEFDKFQMDQKSRITLDNIKTILENNKHIIVNLEGHTDAKGPAEYNQTLSLKRAQATKNYLIKQGVNQNRIKVKGLGESRPASPNKYPDGSDNPKGRQLNRRTEIKISLGQ